MVCLAAPVRRRMKTYATMLCLLGFTGFCAIRLPAQTAASGKPVEKVMLDTDIGDDIDDAFALALALRSPEIEIIGITTAWGDTTLRAKLANRLVGEGDGGQIPVLVGVATNSKSNFTQRQWANQGEAAK